MSPTDVTDPVGAEKSGVDTDNNQPIGIGPIVLMLLMIGLVVVIVFSAMSPVADPDPQNHQAFEKRLPQLRLQPLIKNGEPLTLEDLDGKVVVLNFWTTWCTNCRMDMPHVAEIGYEFQQDEDFVLLPVLCDDAESLDGLREKSDQYLESMGIKLRIYADLDTTTQSAFNQIGPFEGYPTTIVLDREGVVQGVWPGYDPRLSKWLIPMVRDLLDKKS